MYYENTQLKMIAFLSYNCINIIAYAHPNAIVKKGMKEKWTPDDDSVFFRVKAGISVP